MNGFPLIKFTVFVSMVAKGQISYFLNYGTYVYHIHKPHLVNILKYALVPN